MNERIKKLAKRSGFFFHNAGYFPIQHTVPAEYSEKCFERFAELIIRECINIAYEYDKPKLSGPGLAIASNIESHFDIYIEEDGRFVK